MRILGSPVRSMIQLTIQCRAVHLNVKKHAFVFVVHLLTFTPVYNTLHLNVNHVLFFLKIHCRLRDGPGKPSQVI